MIFTQKLGSLEGMSAERAIRTVANYVRALQEQLEYTLTTLDSDNVIEIDTGRTSVSAADGGTATGERILVKGNGGAAFSVEKTQSGGIVLRMTADDGGDIFSAGSGSGVIELRSRGALALDGGSW
ncbi:MAG: hypothetical protein J5756_01935 [Clostridia bacterium]|nr:hypothetical protein [Clostridia bacterium]MBR4439156.1 hypothetical protein [Clostridia bacterium]MBR5769721.1 hypothetical protein [Clostridia bacterium]